MATPEYDVVVVGGGPAGATAARQLVAWDYDICVLEKEELPRQKLRGGLITHKTTHLLERVFGMDAQALFERAILNHRADEFAVYYEETKLMEGRLELRPEDTIEPGEEAWLVADPAGLSPRHIQHAAWIEVEDPAVVSVDRSAVLGESPGETSVSLAEVRVDGDYHTIDPPLEGTVTVEDPGSELVVEPKRSTLEPGERTPVDVSILEPDGTTTDVTEEATIAVGDRSVVGYDDGEFEGLEPGQTQIVVAYEWHEANTTVVVEEADGLAGPHILVVGLAVLVGTVAASRVR